MIVIVVVGLTVGVNGELISRASSLDEYVGFAARVILLGR